MSLRRPTPLQYSELLLVWVLRHLPLDWVSSFGEWMGRRHGRAGIRARRLWVGRLHRNFQRYLGVEDAAQRDRMVEEYMGRIGRIFAEYAILQRLFHKGRVEVVGRENLQNLSRPTIIVSCHLSNWELAGSVMSMLHGGGTALFAPLENSIRNRLTMQARSRWLEDSELVPASTRSMRQLMRALGNRRNLLIYIDEQRENYVWSPSLGRKLGQSGNRWMTAKLAVRYNADIVPVHVEPAGLARYRLVIEPKLVAGDMMDEKIRVGFLADQMDKCFDGWIRAQADCWFWLSIFEPDMIAPVLHSNPDIATFYHVT